MKPETKLWHELKRTTPKITWTSLVNTSLLGTPDLLGYNTSGHFFTVELKVTSGKKYRFSPHQISFHTSHPHNTFILAKHHGHGALILVPGSKIQELLREGFACSSIARGSWSTVLETLLAC